MPDTNRVDVASETRRIMIELARHDRAYGELPEWDEEPWPEGLDAYELAEALSEAERWKRAAGHLIDRIKSVFTDEVVEHGAIRIGGTVYATRSSRTRKLRDPDALWAFLGDKAHLAIRADSSNVRISILKKIAEERGIDPQAVEDTFFTWEGEHDLKLNVLPADGKYTPKWAKELAEGERRA